MLSAFNKKSLGGGGPYRGGNMRCAPRLYVRKNTYLT